jgi:hypothetical protein
MPVSDPLSGCHYGKIFYQVKFPSINLWQKK